MSCEKPKTAAEGARLLMRHNPGMGLGTALCYAEMLLGRDPVEPLHPSCRCVATPLPPVSPSARIRCIKNSIMTDREVQNEARFGDRPGPYTRAILAWLDAQAEQAANAKVAEWCKRDAQRTADTWATPIADPPYANPECPRTYTYQERKRMAQSLLGLCVVQRFSDALLLVTAVLEAQAKL